MKHPKQKGSEFERKVAKMLTEWSGSEFHRTPMSGALHWSNDSRVVSDIVPPESLSGWPFSIECKNVECSWGFDTFINGTSTTLKEHWRQAEGDARSEGMVPMLVFTKNYRDIYLMMTESDYLRASVDIDSMTLDRGGVSYRLARFSDFLDSTSCEDIISKFS